MNFPRIELPDELAQRLSAAKEQLRDLIARAFEKDSAVARELAELEPRAERLERDMPTLKQSALTNSEAAGQLANVERQLQAIRERIAALGATAVERGGLTLASAQPAFRDLIRFYFDALPLAIETHCALFYRNSSDIRNALPLFECVQVLRSLRDRGYSLPSMPATENNVGWLFGIFDRALRGQPHLAIDQTEYMEATKS